MACYHPLVAWRGQVRNPETGKRPVTFRFAEGFADRPVNLPCGTCVGCRLERARQWAVRCVHEASLHDANCFVTLTYDDEHLPPGGSLRPEDFVKFMKRLRHVAPGVRFFQCGEYGSQLERPHHHAVLFNCGFKDREFYRERRGVRLDTSRTLSELWPYGFSTVGECNFETAGYVARYTIKKQVGMGRSGAEPPGSKQNHSGRVKEYLTMSRRPGIGSGWIKRFASDVYPSDELVLKGHVSKPPRYYDDVVAKENPELLAEVRQRRVGAGQFANPFLNSQGVKLTVAEEVKLAAVRTLSRELEI